MASLKHYLMLGGKYGLVSLLVAATLYVLFVLRPWKKRELSKVTRAKWFLSLWYCTTLLLVVFAGRSPFIQATNFRPFKALWGALVSTDRHAWIQLALNILSFVPLGLLLVWHAQGKEKGRRLYLLALLAPLVIEVLQYATRLGTLDVDDLIANSLGALWGISLGSLVVSLKARKKTVATFFLLSILPILLLTLGLWWLSARPYGFLLQDFADPEQGKPVSVDTSSLEGQLPAELPVYRLETPPKTDAEQIADRLFAALDLKRNLDFHDEYDDFADYRAENSNVYAWVYNNGESFLAIPNGLPCGEASGTDTALSLLERAGFALPPHSGQTGNRLLWSFVPDRNRLFDGEITVQAKDGMLNRIDYRLHALQPGYLTPAMDALQLQKAILKGHFTVTDGPRGQKADEILCQSVQVEYVLDSKGVYRPVYQITCLIDGEPGVILAPAF